MFDRDAIEAELAELRKWFSLCERSRNPVGWDDRKRLEAELVARLAKIDGK